MGVWHSGNGATGVTATGRLRDRTHAATRAEYSWLSGASDAPSAYASPSSTRSTVAPLIVGAFARVRLYASGDGATQLAANVSGQLSPGSYDGDIPSYGVGAGFALAQRVGPLVLHLAPSARVAGGRMPYAEVAGAIVFPILPRVTGSFESALAGGGQRTVLGASWTGALEMGGGVRFDLGRVKLDLGYRGTTGVGTPADSPTRGRAAIGTHIRF